MLIFPCFPKNDKKNELLILNIFATLLKMFNSIYRLSPSTTLTLEQPSKRRFIALLSCSFFFPSQQNNINDLCGNKETTKRVDQLESQLNRGARPLIQDRTHIMALAIAAGVRGIGRLVGQSLALLLSASTRH